MRIRTLALPRTSISLVMGAIVVAAFSLAVLFASAQAAPVIETAIHSESDATTTITVAEMGTVVYDTVSVASSTGPTPEGTVDFNLYANTSCTGDPVVEAAVALVGGLATSSTTTVPATGLSYKVHYNGQTDVYAEADGECEPLLPTASNVSLSTELSTTTIMAGESVHDSATLSGATAAATGTVAYRVYTNNQCTTGEISAGTKAVTAALVPNSDTLQFDIPGVYYWQALYSGDQYNAAATSTCSSEVLTVFSTSTPETGTIVVDKVTNPSGNAASFHFTTSGSGYVSFNLTDGSVPNSQVLEVGTYSVSEDAKAGWELTSAQCATNGTATTTYTPGASLVLGAGDTIACTFINATTTAPEPPAEGDGSISGEKYHDLNRNGVKDEGEPGLSGWTIKIYSMDISKAHGRWWHGLKWGFWGRHNNEAVESDVTDESGNYSFDNLTDGTYLVREVPQKGWHQTSRNPGPVVIEGGSSIDGIDFGNVSRSDDGTPNGKEHRKEKRERAGHDDGDDDDGDDDDGDDDDHGHGLGAKINAKVHAMNEDILNDIFGYLFED